ncbi:helix-turn-helix domain-containing protein [Klebsiella pneumoniae]|uniref:helix-turn-helix domain-containing protein n=1 Tax=Klebsiella pneumoniae complex TaxID=3390273 RepID=UPI0009070298|nr:MULTISPECIES: helix-turn-helix domain-containing protein [Klebsiella]MEC7322692.1 helix-turn-helix domain-containing protein [Klebsiella pneumoniae]MEC7326472.1 helix-turn-helix domain-containing protein [Klebsiella pneumoniae]MEC7338375.1 helix-turn-helix domain-containing protein [Klebsiella pneumoniae]UDC67332.1 helix-turn-helix domain-containing protein [Klebsiella quasipneumoniae subsp. quasipneumoniae]
MTKHDDISARIISRRASLGWTQERLSKESGVAAAQISRYEAGTNKPRANVIAKLASAMAVDFSWLAYGEHSHPDWVETDIVLPMELKEEVVKQAKARGMTEEEFLLYLLRSSLEYKKPT